MTLIDIGELEYWEVARKASTEDLVKHLEYALDISTLDNSIYFEELKKRLNLEHQFAIQGDVTDMKMRQEYGTPESQIVDVNEETLERLPGWKEELTKRIAERSKDWSIEVMQSMIDRDMIQNPKSLWIPELELAIKLREERNNV